MRKAELSCGLESGRWQIDRVDHEVAGLNGGSSKTGNTGMVRWSWLSTGRITRLGLDLVVYSVRPVSVKKIGRRCPGLLDCLPRWPSMRCWFGCQECCYDMWRVDLSWTQS